MKRQIVSIDKMASMNALWNAWIKISSGDGKDKRPDVIAYGEHLDENLARLAAALLAGTWQPDKGHTTWIYTENKWRMIHIVNVETRLVYQLLVDAFKFKRLFVGRTFGAIKGRGTLRASKQVRRDLYRHPELDYVIKTDFHHYYQSIIKQRLMDMVCRKYKGRAALELLERCLAAYNIGEPVSISIGAVTSQDLGNLYLTPIDRFILEELKMSCLARLVDDTVILCRREDGARVIPRLKEKAKELGLEYGRIEFFPISDRRIDFCGWAVNRTNVRVRQSTVRRYRRRLGCLQKRPERINRTMSVVGSYDGILKFADTYKLNKQIHKNYDEVFARIHGYAAYKRRRERVSAPPAAGR
jgi:hypothetical protein